MKDEAEFSPSDNIAASLTNSVRTRKSNPLTISGYAEVYYQYYFSNPFNNKRLGFIYSHDRNNEMNKNNVSAISSIAVNF